MSGFGGSSGGTAMVRMVLDTGGFQSKLSAAQSQTVAATSKMGTSFTKLGGIAKQVLGTLGAVEVIRRSIAAYDEQVKAVARLNVAFGNSPALIGASTAAFVEQASALSKLTGVQDEQIISAMAALSVFNLTADQLARIAPLVLDYAAFTGTDVTSAAESMGRAVLGNARALKTIGIDFKRTGDSAADFESIMAQVGDKVGGSAAAMATPMDKMRVAADEAFESIGEGLAPSLTAVAEVLQAIPAPVLAAAAAFGVLSLAIGGIPALVAVASAGFAGFINSINPAKGALEEFGAELADLFGGTRGGVELVPDSAIQSLTDMADAVDAGTMSMADFKTEVDAFNSQYGTGLDAAALAGRDLANLAARADAAGSAIANFAGMTADELETWEEQAASSLNFVTDALGRVAGRANSTAAGVLKAMQIAINAQFRYKENSATVFDAVRQEYGSAGDGFIEYVSGLGTGGARLVGILAAMAGNNRAKFNSIIADFNRAAGVAQTTASQIAGIGSAINGLPTYKGITIKVTTSYVQIGSGKPLPVGDGGIVYGASGFITKGPTMFRPGMVAGEAHYSTPFGKGAEAVIPLTDATLDRLADAITRRGGGGGTVKVYGPGDPDLIADAVVRKMARMR